MERRFFIKTLATGAAAAGLGTFVNASRVPEKSSPSTILDNWQYAPLEDVRLTGYTGRLVDLCIDARIQAQDEQRLEKAFSVQDEKTCWQTEFWGKWVLSAVDALRYRPDPVFARRVHESASRLITYQLPDGYLGNYPKENRLTSWDVWGRKYTLLGLLACDAFFKDGKFIDAAVRLLNLTVQETDPSVQSIVRTGNYRGMPSSSILEPVVQLYRVTGEIRYLDYARQIVAEWSKPYGPQLIEKALAGVPVADRFPVTRPGTWWSWENGQKAYEMMSCYEGLLELYRETHEVTFRQAVVKAWEAIRDQEINVAGSGASMECWYHGRDRQAYPARHTMETCVTQTWMKLSANLLRLTGESRYMDALEISAMNALTAAMYADGSAFAKYSPLDGVRAAGEEQCNMGLHCCTANGPRGMMLVPGVAVMTSPAGVAVNGFEPFEAIVTTPAGGRLRLMLQGNYPVDPDVVLHLNPERPEQFAVDLRIPSWSIETTASVNGVTVDTIQPGSYLRIKREWTTGDRIALHLDLRGRTETASVGLTQKIAVLRGPLLLARDRRFAGGKLEIAASPAVGKDQRLELKPAGTGQGVRASFELPYRNDQHDASGSVVVCDYASAGNTWTEASSYRTWFEPVFTPEPS